MAYTKTVWINREPPSINATNLNNMEQGIYDANLANNITVVDDTYQVLDTDGVIVCNKATAFAVTLLAAAGSERIQTIKNINTGVVTVTASGADTIDGSATLALYQWEAAQLFDYASGKWVVI